jgi:Zn ribbon nucleic-acid-binding protein
MISEPDYSVQWRDFRRRRLIAAVCCPGIMLIMVLAYGLMSRAGFSRAWIDPIIGIPGMGAFFWVGYRVQAFPCPRCNQPFHGGLWRKNPFRMTECIDCGLPFNYGDSALN